MKFAVASVLVVLVGVALAEGGNWPSWRGPEFNGVAPGTGFPLKWSSTENVAWKFALPGKGASTPIVWDRRIILTAAIEESNGVICLGLDGKPLWQTKIGSEVPGKHNKATGCNPSAVTDGRHIYVYFKSGDFACLDFNGGIVWRKNMHDLSGEDTLWWDLGTSPVLTKKFVVVAVIHSGPSFLAAFDKETGETAWKADRNLDAPSEAAQTYATPVVVTEEGRETIIALGADHVTAYEAAEGKELWRVGGLNPNGEKYFRSIASPVVTEGIVIAPYARGSTLTAIRLGGSGDVTKTHVAWTRDDLRKENLATDVPTPVAIDGKVYVCSDRGTLACLDAKTGKMLWSGQTEKHRTPYSASPVLADGRIYLTREDGKTFVAEQGKGFKLLAANELQNELVVATPVLVDGRILIRTAEHLYCIGK
jgi:outer membrane protein assembly factor BamB